MRFLSFLFDAGFGAVMFLGALAVFVYGGLEAVASAGEVRVGFFVGFLVVMLALAEIAFRSGKDDKGMSDFGCPECYERFRSSTDAGLHLELEHGRRWRQAKRG